MRSKDRPAVDTPATAERPRLWPAWVMIVGCVGVAFSPALDNGFVDWDDPSWIVGNDAIRGLGWDQIQFAFATTLGGVYQPLGWLFQGFVYACSGLDPRGFHRAGLLVHALNAVLLHRLCVRLLARAMPEAAGRRSTAWLCAIPVTLWAVHPLRVEPVAWASSQAYLPGVTFSVLATLAYLRAHPVGGGSSWRWMVGSSVLVVLAVLAKGSAVVLPVVFLILDLYPLGRLSPGRPRWFAIREVMLEKAPILAFCLVLTAVAVVAKRSAVEPEEVAGSVVFARVAQGCFGAWFYLIKTAWPFGITAFYPRPDRGDFATPLFAASVLGLVLAGLVAVWRRRSWPWFLASLATYLVVAAPYLGLVRVGLPLAADRYSYAPTMAWVVLGCAGLVRSRWPRPILMGAGAGVLITASGLMGLCSDQCRVWGSSERLWRQAVEQAPWSSELHDDLGASLVASGETSRAIPEFREAVRLRPDSFQAVYHLGAALDRIGQTDEAITDLIKAAKLRPADAKVHLGLGIALLSKRRGDEAIAELTKAAKLGPGSAEAHATLGGALALRGRLAEAIAEDREALQLDPDRTGSRINLGLSLARLRMGDEAVAELREATRRDPKNPQAHHVLGAVLIDAGRADEAAPEFEEVLRLRPDHAQARTALARARRRR